MLRDNLRPFTPERFVFQLHDVGAVSIPKEGAELLALFGFDAGSMQHNFFAKPNKKETRVVGVLAEAKDVVDLASPKVVATAFGVVRRKTFEIGHVGVRKAHPANESGKGERWGVQGIAARKKGNKTEWVHAASGAKLNKGNAAKLLVGSPNPYATSCLGSLIQAVEATYASQRVDMACAHLFSSQYDHAAHPAIYLVYRALDFDFISNQDAMDWDDARRPPKESVSRMRALMAEGRPVVDPRPPAAAEPAQTAIPRPPPAQPTSRPTPAATASTRVPKEAPPLQVAAVPRVDGQSREKRVQLFKKSLRLLEVATGAIVQVVKAADLVRIKKAGAGGEAGGEAGAEAGAAGDLDAVAAAVRTLDRRLRGCDDGFKLKASVDALLQWHATAKPSGACLLLAWRLPASGRDDAQLVGAATLANLGVFERLHTEPAQYTMPARVKEALAPLIDRNALWLDAICAKNSGVRRLLLLHAYQRSLNRGGLATMAPAAVQAATGELGFQTLLGRAKLRVASEHKPDEVALVHKPPDAKGVYALAATGLGVCARRGLTATTKERLVWRC